MSPLSKSKGTRKKPSVSKKKLELKQPLGEAYLGTVKEGSPSLIASEKLYRDLVEMAHEGITMVDPKDTVVFVNKQFARGLGYEINELVGKSLFSIATRSTAARMKKERAKRKDGKRSRYEVTLIHADGTRKYYWLSASPMYSPGGKFVGSMGVYSDVTEKRIMEIKLKSAQSRLSNFNRELKKTVKEKTLHLERANKRLQSLNQIKDEFIAVTSHELRSPLTSIRGYLSFLVEDEALSQLSEPYREYLVRAYSTTDSLNYLINNILDVSRLDMGRFELQRQQVDIIKLTSNILDSLAFQFSEGRLNLEFVNNTGKKQLVIPVDSIRLSQVLRNILDNSIKFTKRGKKIGVSITLKKGMVCVAVADQGVGIPKAKLDQVFDKFMQVKNTHTKYKGGVGLGLFIAKRIVELHGGTICATKNKDCGTTISICLPLKSKA